MKHRFRSILPALVLGLTIATGANTTMAQGFATPGPEHELLKKNAGEWIATIKSSEGDTTGTQSGKMECGGLWLVTEFKGEFGGQPFQGRGFDGYDPVRKKYVSVWVDSMSTKPLFLEGDMDKEKKTLTLSGEGPGPDGAPVKYKNVTKFTDDDHHTFTMHIVGSDGSATPMLTIEYSRKK